MDPTRCLELPDLISIDAGDGWRAAAGAGVERAAAGVTVRLARAEGLAVQITGARVRAVRLRWHLGVGAARLLGDTWERGYGDLEWRCLVAERPMPWYVLIHDGARLHGLGVATGAGAMAAWFIDASG